MVDALEKANVEYRPIQLAEQGRTEQDIINRLSGGDMTKGSCSSLALAYAGNKAGYDVLVLEMAIAVCSFRPEILFKQSQICPVLLNSFARNE